MKNLAKEFIKKHEGFSASEYICPAGFRTIGYGRNVQSNPLSDSERALLVGGKISEKHAELLLEREIEKIYAQLSQKSFFSRLNTPRGAVLIDMVYNIGMARFNGFKRMLSSLEQGDYIGASIEMRNSKWFNQVGKRGEFLVQVMERGKVPQGAKG